MEKEEVPANGVSHTIQVKEWISGVLGAHKSSMESAPKPPSIEPIQSVSPLNIRGIFASNSEYGQPYCSAILPPQAASIDGGASAELERGVHVAASKSGREASEISGSSTSPLTQTQPRKFKNFLDLFPGLLVAKSAREENAHGKQNESFAITEMQNFGRKGETDNGGALTTSSSSKTGTLSGESATENSAAGIQVTDEARSSISISIVGDTVYVYRTASEHERYRRIRNYDSQQTTESAAIASDCSYSPSNYSQKSGFSRLNSIAPGVRRSVAPSDHPSKWEWETVYAASTVTTTRFRSLSKGTELADPDFVSRRSFETLNRLLEEDRIMSHGVSSGNGVSS